MRIIDKIYKSKYANWIIQHLLILIFILAFFLRVAPNIYLELRQPGWHANNINEMEFYYDDVARSLIAGKGFVHSVDPRSEGSPYKFQPGTPFHFVPPLYAWWLGIVYFLFGPNVLIAKILQCLMDASVCLLLYKIGRIITDNRVSLTAAFLYAVYPLAIYTSTRLYYQIPMNLALCWLIVSFAAPVNLKNGMWTGIAMALSALAKPVTLPFLVLIPVIRLFESFNEKVPIKSSLLWSISFLLAASLTLSPWTIRNYTVFHKFIPIQGGGGAPLIQGSKEEYIDLDVDTLRKKYGQSFEVKNDQFVEVALNNHLNHLKNAPLDYIRFLVKKFLLTWYNTEGKNKNFLTLLMQLPFLIFALFGFITSFKYWLRKPNWYILGLISFITGIQVIFFPLARYTLAIMPLVMLLAALGINKLLVNLKIFRN
ncbi:MAG: glycosyltransferase family 39 protein [Nitrospirota bacterium]